MNIPERKYYPISEAAKRLSCSEEDIIHLVATDCLDAYIYMNNYRLSDGNKMHLSMSGEWVEAIDDFNSISGDSWDIYDIERIENYFPHLNLGYFCSVINGLFYIYGHYVAPLEFESEVINVDFLSTKKETGEGDSPVDVNFLNGSVAISKGKLCILNSDIISFLNKGAESNKTIAKKGEIIKSLLMMLPEFEGEDIEIFSVAKIKEIIEAAAAKKGVDFPKTDIGTWSKYLERGRHKK